MNSIAIGILDIVLGFACILTGLKIFWPFRKDFEEKVLKRKGWFLVAGLILVVWGLLNLFAF